MDSRVQDSEYLVAKLVQDAREAKFKTAKLFWNAHQKELDASYSHYSAVESGKKFPDIELLLRIAKCLHIDERLACHAWAKDQMPNAVTRTYFEPNLVVEKQGSPLFAETNLDDYYVLNETQISAFEKYPNLWDILSIINASTVQMQGLTEKDLLRITGLPKNEISNTVEWLRNEGFVISNEGRLKRRRRWFHIPNSSEFKHIRDKNMIRITDDLVKKITLDDLLEKRAYRVTFMRCLDPKQAQEIVSQVDKLMSGFGSFDDTGNSLYAMTLAFGPRYQLKVV